MATFYTRYIPPEKGASQGALNGDIETSSKTKRRHDTEDVSTSGTPKRRKVEQSFQDHRTKQTPPKKYPHNAKRERTLQEREEKDRKTERAYLQQDQASSDKIHPEEKLLAKYSVTKRSSKKAPGNGLDDHEIVENNAPVRQNLQVEQASQLSVYKQKRKTILVIKKDDEHVVSNGVEQAAEDHASNSLDEGDKHGSIRSKFERSKAQTAAGLRKTAARDRPEGKQEHGVVSDEGGTGKDIELHGLEPFPQPDPDDKLGELPTYSTSPDWLAKPLQVSSATTSTFDDLGISQNLATSLATRGLKDAFPVQTAVIPLLLQGTQRHHGDICISAATGSGKTLAYILPMMEALRGLATRKLRGVVVVPTRELVKQAREVGELCAAGTGLKIATALGSKSLKEEQTLLIEKRLVYDPEQYEQEQVAERDWTKFSLQEAFQELAGEADRWPNYVTKYHSTADILICTPGRLVDHLRSTRGFTLDDVQWLVIDEADRLLNESFQEWVDVVVPALRSQNADEPRNRVLRHMRMDVPERVLQKVILSATLTRDISKLNSLDLRCPKLIVVSNGDTSAVQQGDNPSPVDTVALPDANGIISLPATLLESAISVGDGYDKPLYLLELIKNKIIQQREPGSDEDTSVSEESTTSDSSSDTSTSSRPRRTSPRTENDTKQLNGLSKSASALIFTRSTESATRLSRLLSILDPSLSHSIGTITKSENSSSTRRVISSFCQSKLSILVATDRASRGLDLPGLANVISYDVPSSVTTYVHRVGRTARAGKAGHAWTLLAHREARWFWNEIGKGHGEIKISRNGKVSRVTVDLPNDEVTKRQYDDALRVLGEDVRGKAESKKKRYPT